MTVPTWLTPNVFACHLPTKTVFQPVKWIRKATQHLYLIDPANDQHLLDECDRLHQSHLSGVALLITPRTAFPLLPCTGGVILQSPKRKLKVTFPPPDLLAAQQLADFFNGAIYTEDL